MEKVAFDVPANEDVNEESEKLKINVYNWLAWIDSKNFTENSKKIFTKHPEIEKFLFSVSWEYDDEGSSKLEVYVEPKMKVDDKGEDLPEPYGIESELKSFVIQHMTPSLYGAFVNIKNNRIKKHTIDPTCLDSFVKEFEPEKINEIKVYSQELNLLSTASKARLKKV